MNARRNCLIVSTLGAAAALLASSPLWAEVATADRLSATPAVSGVFWTLVMPLLLFAVSFAAAYALYRHFSAK